MYLPSGRVLGGSSSINGLLFVRGPAEEYDRWRDAGCPGWGWEDVAPCFAGSSTIPPATRPTAAGAAPSGSATCPTGCVDRGVLPRVHRPPDPGDPPTTTARATRGWRTSSYPRTGGRRSSAAAGYLRPARARRNLELALHCRATSVVVEEGRAAGIACRLPDGSARLVRAAREVVLSAGAMNTPAAPRALRHRRRGASRGARRSTSSASPGGGREPPGPPQHALRLPLHAAHHGQRRAPGPVARGRDDAPLPRHPAGPHGDPRRVGARPRQERPGRGAVDLKLQVTHLSGRTRYAMTGDHGIDTVSGFMLGSTPAAPAVAGVGARALPGAGRPPRDPRELPGRPRGRGARAQGSEVAPADRGPRRRCRR